MVRKKRLFVKDIAQATGIAPNVIRRLADQGKIECRRDWNGWRIFPESAIEQVKVLAGITNGNSKQPKAEREGK